MIACCVSDQCLQDLEDTFHAEYKDCVSHGPGNPDRSAAEWRWSLQKMQKLPVTRFSSHPVGTWWQRVPPIVTPGSCDGFLDLVCRCKPQKTNQLNGGTPIVAAKQSEAEADMLWSILPFFVLLLGQGQG